MMASMTDSRWFIIANPASGGGRVRRDWPRLRHALERQGVAFEFRSTAAPGDAAQLARHAVIDGYRRLLALGGDGTFNELVNGLWSQDTVPPWQCLAAAAASGTGNDWSREMQVPDDPDRLAACMQRGRSRSVDLGVAEDAAGTRTIFHNVAGAGLDAEVLRHLPRRGPRSLAYLIGLLRTIAGFRAPRFCIRADGRERSGEFWLALALIGPRFGGGMRLAPSVRIDDGCFDLVTIDPMSFGAALARLPKLRDGRLAGDPAIRVTRCRTISIEADPPCGVEFDGQRSGTTPLQLTIRPQALSALDCRESGAP